MMTGLCMLYVAMPAAWAQKADKAAPKLAQVADIGKKADWTLSRPDRIAGMPVDAAVVKFTATALTIREGEGETTQVSRAFSKLPSHYRVDVALLGEFPKMNILSDPAKGTRYELMVGAWTGAALKDNVSHGSLTLIRHEPAPAGQPERDAVNEKCGEWKLEPADEKPPKPLMLSLGVDLDARKLSISANGRKCGEVDIPAAFPVGNVSTFGNFPMRTLTIEKFAIWRE